jgi:hypothetical protein
MRSRQTIYSKRDAEAFGLCPFGRHENGCSKVNFLSATRCSSFSTFTTPYTLLAVTFVFLATLASAGAQAIAAEAMLALPDAPGATSSSADPAPDPASGAFRFDSLFTLSAPSAMASRTTKDIAPGQQAPRLTIGDKILLGFRSSVTPFSLTGWVFSAGYSQAVNGSPNYGTNAKAFAQRLGAAAARNESEGVFSDSLMAPLFHEDPRYYELGRGHPFVRRLVYAATRTFVTRTDDGKASPNYALFFGNVGGAALTNAYYPSQNRGFGNTAKTFGLSLGGSSLGFIVTEFYTDALEVVHLKKTP